MTTIKTLRKFQVTFYLHDGSEIKQRIDGVTVEAIEDALHQKLSQKELIFIADGTERVGEKSSGRAAPFLRVESRQVLRYVIEEITRSARSV